MAYRSGVGAEGSRLQWGTTGWEGAGDGIWVSQRLEHSLKTGPWFPWHWDPIWLDTCLLVFETGSLVVQTGLSFYAVEGGLELWSLQPPPPKG